MFVTQTVAMQIRFVIQTVAVQTNVMSLHAQEQGAQVQHC
jgi:hypothetical protein